MVYQRIVLLFISWFATSIQAFAVVDNTQLSVWVNEAIVATYTYDYKTYLPRQKEIASYFTAKGWIAYSKALQDSKLPEAVQKNAYYVSAVATMPPKITLVRDGYWQAVMPLLVVYQNPQYQQKQNIEITLQFVAAPSGQGVRGLAITSLQTKPIKTPDCKCPSTAIK